MIKQKLQEDLTASLKQGDQLKRSVLGMLNSAIKNRELAKRTQLSKTVSDTAELSKQSELTDDEVMEVIASEVKKRKESIEQFKQGNRQDLADKEQKEAEILTGYLPEQLSEDEIRTEVEATIKELNPQGLKDMGKVIGAVMAKLKGRADGSTVSRLVKENLK